jgi:hypothetical protein
MAASPDWPATATHTSVGDSASSVALTAANAARLWVHITNDSTAVLYVKLGATASATDYAARLEQYDTVKVYGYEYTGVIHGIWSSDAGGAARVVVV